MAEDINELLEQCEQRTQVLSQESDHAANEVSQIVQRMVSFLLVLARTTQSKSGMSRLESW